MRIDKHLKRQEVLPLSAAAALAAGGGFPAAVAQDAEPPNLAKVILASHAGTLMDLFARRIADAIQPAYARNVIAGNRVGTVGLIAVTPVKTALPDRATVLALPLPLMCLYPFTIVVT